MSTEKSIIGCVEGDATADPDEYPFGLPSDVRPPRLFRDGGFDPIGAIVVEINDHLGTYGMGGPGFLGLRVAGGRPPEPRWLVVTLWAASRWLTLDGDLIEEDFSDDERAELAAEGRRFRSVNACLTGAKLVEADCGDDLMVMRFERNGTYHLLELRRDGRDVPPLGTGEPRALGQGESMRDVVVVSEAGYLWTADDESVED